MGNTIGATILKDVIGQKKVKIIFNGLDAAGKTTLLWNLKLGEVKTEIPQIGFCLNRLEYKNVELVGWYFRFLDSC